MLGEVLAWLMQTKQLCPCSHVGQCYDSRVFQAKGTLGIKDLSWARTWHQGEMERPLGPESSGEKESLEGNEVREFGRSHILEPCKPQLKTLDFIVIAVGGLWNILTEGMIQSYLWFRKFTPACQFPHLIVILQRHLDC